MKNPTSLLNFFVILVFPIAVSGSNRSCGFGNSVPYPFGFSEDSIIRLQCIGNKIFFKEFLVRNITSDALRIDLPPNCNRSIDVVREFFGPNYAMTWQNGLLLRNCRSAESGCIIPTALLADRFELQSCHPNSNNESVNCYSKEDSGFMRQENVTESGCEILFSSVAVEPGNSSPVSLDFRTVELGWWMQGECGPSSCSLNATCSTVDGGGVKGFRCLCDAGFDGDGFLKGDGCRRVSINCNSSRYISGHCGNNRVGVLIGGIVAGASLMAGLAAFCFFIRRRSLSLRNRKSMKRLLSEAAGSCTVPFYQYREIERATNGFSEKQRLGTGAYGTVYAGKLHNDEWVAVKKIRHRENDGMEQVMNEIKLLSSVSHPNLVRLLGFCIERGEQILMYEFMPNGTLAQHLQRERGNGLPWTVRIKIAAETAKAIAYLHSANPPIYHRDIKSSNILLDYNFNSKVADFGLSRLGIVESSHISTAPQGTPGYLDPQYHQNFHLSDKSDVYSFGVVLIEIISAMKVVDFSRVHTEVNLAALAIDKIGKGCVDEMVDPFLEPHTDAWTLSSIHKVAEIAFTCLAFHRDMRPSMTEVADELERIKLSGLIQSEGNICDGSSISSFSSMSNNSINSRTTTTKKTASVESRKLVVPHSNGAPPVEETNDFSPSSVQDPWLSDQSSPSSNSLLSNVVQ